MISCPPIQKKGHYHMKKLYIELFPKSDLEREWEMHKEYFDSGDPKYQICMRCGKPMRPRLAENALSRALDIHVCPACGTDEALRDAMDDVLPMSEWYSVKHHYFSEADHQYAARLLPTCSFSQIFSAPKKKLPLSGLEYPAPLVAYSRSDYDGRQWWTNWFGRPEDKPEKDLALEIDLFQDKLMARSEFKTLRSMTRMCKLYAQPTNVPTEFNLYSETENFYIWLRLITLEREHNLYAHYYLKV